MMIIFNNNNNNFRSINNNIINNIKTLTHLANFYTEKNKTKSNKTNKKFLQKKSWLRIKKF